MKLNTMQPGKPTAKGFLLGALLLLGACDFYEQPDFEYNDAPQIAFAQPRTVVETVDEGAGTVMAEVQLIGPQRNSDLQIDFAVADSSSAEAGQQFEIEGNSVTILAGESSTSISIDVLDNDVDDGGTSYQLFVALQDSDAIEAAENLKVYTLVIRGLGEEESGEEDQ